MMCYDWPGNVRELKNVVERLLITSSVGTMEIQMCIRDSIYIMLIVFGINLLGDFLRDEFNPKLK